MAPTILVVDDDTEVVRMLQESLQLEGYGVVTGYDGQDALRLARKRKPDLIIMDIQMPVINGLKALEFLRASQETRDIPIIFLSGAPSDGIYAVVDASPRLFFVKKPLELDNIQTLVRQILQRYHILL